MKKIWKIISESLNKNSVPDTMLIDGIECSDRKKIAEKLYFISVGKLEDENTDQNNEYNFCNYMNDQINTQFTFHPIDNIDTKRMIKNIKVSKSKEHDGISSEVLKLISNDISRLSVDFDVTFAYIIFRLKGFPVSDFKHGDG